MPEGIRGLLERAGKLTLPLLVPKDDAKNGKRRLKAAAEFCAGRTLEIGCAEFPNRYIAAPVVGYDLFTPATLPSNFVDFVEGNVADIDGAFAEGSFDTVCALEVIEHLPDCLSFVSSLSRLTRSGGTVVLSTPNPYWWLMAMANTLFPTGLSSGGSGGGLFEKADTTLGPYFGHINLQIPRVLNRIAHERHLDAQVIRPSAGAPLRFLSPGLLYVFKKR